MSNNAAQQKLILAPLTSPLEINLRHLRALSAVASAGSIAAASQNLFRVPSAVTRSIGELEMSLGRPLFERRARGMVLNAYGDIVLNSVKRIEAEFEAARTQVLARGATPRNDDSHALFGSILNGRRLAVFASLADKRNMPAVAREFQITQPAISTALKDLERVVGVLLFERSARGLRPTPEGEVLAFYFRRVLAELRNIGPEIAARDGVLHGSVHVGALPLGRTQVLPLAIASLISRYTQLHVTTVESPYDVLVASLRSGDIDFILGALRPASQSKDLLQEPLFEDEIALIARAGHPLSRSRHIDFDALRRERWVLSRPGSPSRELLEAFFAHSIQAPPVPAIETGDLAVLRGLLLESDLVTAISAHQLRYEIRDGSLVVLNFALERTQRSIGITQRVGAFPSPGARALIAEITRAVTDSPDFKLSRKH